ncbi:GNAT family N-acetyltransferase [Croceivirga sp. JEA036]|uniref:GNAT family N-acetyltransferase n=1 Tax=Croceivirga sp. JEA036 TaxID=2721162 RepID=UPI0014388050|nr:GNAT family N-acetyltransferase [Croceivirga sp. JEA036]NJB37767.1 GNAT family N-acetyltransferase [Croceivirga sp. JEA036]
MKHTISTITKTEYSQVVRVWEAAVRATHHFLKEEDIAYFKPLILNTYLDAVEVSCVRNSQNVIVGFLGVAADGIEMLFVHPEYHGQGIGKALLTHAITYFKATKVDVDEQNPQAVGFYEKFGFKTVKRSPLDASGKPYPILHMELK